jgi:hypothetical protein
MTEFRTLPRSGSATERRELRRDVRAALGVSSDPAPDLRRTMRAVRALTRLVELASNGDLELVLMRRDGGQRSRVLPRLNPGEVR